ncbi:MAG: hypothetical protein JNL58_28680 [Planctomyces sp.]|nr:hypothetical protein [Planctomyces sp.]
MISPHKHADAIRQARAILERWSSSDLLERIQTTPEIPPLAWGTSQVPESSHKVEVSHSVEVSDRNELQFTEPLPPDSSGVQHSGVEPHTVQQFAELDSPEDSAVSEIQVSDEPVLERAPVLEHRRQEDETASPASLVDLHQDAQASLETAITEDNAPTPDAVTLDLQAMAIQPEESFEPLEDPQTATVLGLENSTLPGSTNHETQDPAKPADRSAPKTSEKRPIRRPPMLRRFRRATPEQTQSSGSATVNRKLRVDLPGGETELSDPAGQQQPATAGQKSPVDAATSRVASSVAPEKNIVSNSPSPGGRRFRIDAPASVESIASTEGARVRTQGRPKQRYIDESHGAAPRGPHFQVNPPRRSNLTSMTGQFLAYIGVLGLTVGTAIVIYGHFGGYSEYTPTGWLVTTVAQMLLFLGVINLVSGGIEQNNDEVSRRINTLGEQLMRIEHVTEQALRGPKLSPRLYANPDEADQYDSDRETAEVDKNSV